MTAPATAFLPDILEEHFEELPFLWDQRQGALRSVEFLLDEFREVERRVEAHVRGLLKAGEQAVPLLRDGLEETDASTVFAASYVLLRLDDGPAASLVLDALEPVEDEETLAGLRDGLCHGPITRVHEQLRRLVDSADAPTAVAAAEALAFHSTLELDASQLDTFLDHSDAPVREAGWRLVGHTGAPLSPKRYAAAMRDEDARVRESALTAGAWSRVEGVVAFGRSVATPPSPDHLPALRLLAILGGPNDLSLMQDLGQADTLGPDRYRLLGSYGHPVVVDMVLAGLRDEDPETAAAAAEAFTKITGVSVESSETVAVPLDKPTEESDEFEAEFVEDIAIPDAELARQEWDRLRPRLASFPRICRGFDVAGGLDESSLSQLDMQSRWEACLRGRFQGTWNGSPISLEVFPQRT